MQPAAILNTFYFPGILVQSRLNILYQVLLLPRDMNTYCPNVKLVYKSSLSHQWFQTMTNIGKTIFLPKM